MPFFRARTDAVSLRRFVSFALIRAERTQDAYSLSVNSPNQNLIIAANNADDSDQRFRLISIDYQ